MSRLITQLVADDPAVVLVGENTVLSGKLATALKNKNVSVSLVLPKEIEAKSVVIKNAYKVIWLADQKKTTDNYINFLQKLAKIKTEIIIVLPIFSGINSCQSDLLKNWIDDTQQQLQFIVDCNYYLSSSSFIFGLDVVGNNNDLSVFNYILQASENNILVNLSGKLNFIEINDFVDQVSKLVFIPKKQVSFLIKGKGIDTYNFIELIKKLYDSYHHTNLEIIDDLVEFSKLTPFSVIEKIINSESREIATYLVKNMQAPKAPNTENIPKPTMESPTLFVSNSTKEVDNPENENKSSEFISKSDNILDLDNKVTLPSKPSGLIDITNTVTAKPQIELQKAPTQEMDINQEIQRIFTDTRAENKILRVEKIVESTKKIRKKTKRRTKLFYGGLLSVGMATGMIILALTYFASGIILKKQVFNYLQTVYNEQSFSQKPGLVLTKTAEFVGVQTNLYSQIIELGSLSENSVLVSLVEQLVETPQILSEADQTSKNLVLNIIKGNIGETKELSEILAQKVSKAYEKLSLIQATLEQVDFEVNSNKQQGVLEIISNEISDIRSGLEIYQQLQPIILDLVGNSKKRTYALILQNNQELRPTGGFIQAIALINFDNGNLVSYQVYSINDLDKRLPGKVIPPTEITEFLGEENWYLRDSNWNPDFPEASKQISWFIEKSLGVNVDGVIAINIFSLANLIEAVGPLDLTEYNEVINNKNLEERMEFHSEIVLVDSPKSIDYAVKILTRTLDSLREIKALSVPTLLRSFKNSLDKKQMLLFSTKASEQATFQSLGWSGSLATPNCPSRLSVVDCVVDNLAQVEANVGVNKANYYINRTINHKIMVSRENAQHTRTVTFKNNSPSNSWPKGMYKSYLRFYLNQNSSVDKILINNTELNDKQFLVTNEDKYQVIGLRLDVPIQTEVTLKLIYSTPLTESEDFSYVFYNNKQSGLGADSFKVQIMYDNDIKPVLVAPSAVVTGNIIDFSASSVDDASLFGVKFE